MTRTLSLTVIFTLTLPTIAVPAVADATREPCTIKGLNLFQIFNKNACGISERAAVGVELDASWYEAMRNSPPHVNLENFSGTDEEILSAIVGQLPGYNLVKSENLFSIAPKKQSRDVIGKQLDKQMPIFKSLNAPLAVAFDRLVLKARQSGFAITSPIGEIARHKGRALEEYLPEGPDLYESHRAPTNASEKVVNIIFKGNPSLRHVLNYLLVSQPPGYWFATQNGDEILLVLNGTQCRAHGCSGLPIGAKEVRDR